MKNTLVLENEYGCMEEDYQVRMLTRNQIPLFLKCRTKIVDGQLLFYYDTIDYQPLKTCFLNRNFRKTDMKTLLQGILDAMRNLDAYLLDASGMLLDPEYIFISSDGEQYRFCYVPGRKATFEEIFEKLAEYLLGHLDYTDREGVVFGYDIYRKVREGHACAESMRELLSESGNCRENKSEKAGEAESTDRMDISKSTDNMDKTEDAGNAGMDNTHKKTSRRNNKSKMKKQGGKYVAAVSLAVVAGVIACVRKGVFSSVSPMDARITIEAGASGNNRFLLPGVAAAAVLVFLGVVLIWLYQRKRKKKEPESIILWRETDQIVVDHPTVCLAGESSCSGKLVSMKNQEEVLLKGDIFYVGKLPDRIDLVIREDTVSRIHACLSRENENWYIRDLDSTNGTFVNGKRLSASENVLLSQGDEICFADAEYVYL